MMYVLRDADHVLLGLPMLTCMAGGLGGGLLQQSSYQPLKAAGWFGTHAAIVLGVISGVPLLIYSLTKVIFANLLNELTFNYFDCLKDFKEHAELQFTVTLVVVSALPLIVLSLPHMIEPAYKAYQSYQEFQKAYDDFIQSDLYLTLSHLYTQCRQLFSPQTQGTAATVEEGTTAAVEEIIEPEADEKEEDHVNI